MIVQVTSIVLLGGGIIANTLSFSYFLFYEIRGLPNKTMIMLNFTDLSFCVLFVANVAIYLIGNLETERAVILFVLYTLGSLSGWITFNMSLLRCILVLKPFYRVRKRVFYTSFLTILISVSLLFTYLQFSGNVAFLYFGALLFVLISAFLIIITCTLTVIRLISTRMETESKSRRRATVTILIVGVIYSVTNAPLVVGAVLQNEDFLNLAGTILFPLSSFLNPLVFILRKRGLKAYVLDCAKCRCGKRRNHVGISQSNMRSTVSSFDAAKPF